MGTLLIVFKTNIIFVFLSFFFFSTITKNEVVDN